MAFYSALHRVDAYLATQGIHPSNHRERERLVRTDADLRHIYDHYRTSRDRCDEARYQLRSFSQAEAAALIGDELIPIRDHIARLLGR